MKNVQPWVRAVRENEIESRSLVTNKAIVNTVIEQRPGKVLDVGCGEGWLTRVLVEKGVDVLGIDVVPELIKAAEELAIGRFRVLAYEELSFAALGEKFDVLVCNFSLIGEEVVEHVFRQAEELLNEKGALIIQTINPHMVTGSSGYDDGWQQGSWDGFSEDFCDPAPWYFRTMASWKSLFARYNFKLSRIEEPLNPKTKKAASVIFTGRMK